MRFCREPSKRPRVSSVSNAHAAYLRTKDYQPPAESHSDRYADNIFMLAKSQLCACRSPLERGLNVLHQQSYLYITWYACNPFAQTKRVIVLIIARRISSMGGAIRRRGTRRISVFGVSIHGNKDSVSTMVSDDVGQEKAGIMKPIILNSSETPDRFASGVRTPCLRDPVK